MKAPTRRIPTNQPTMQIVGLVLASLTCGCAMLAEGVGGAEKLPNRGVIPYEKVSIVPAPADDADVMVSADVDSDADVPEPEGEPWVLIPDDPTTDRFTGPSALVVDGRLVLFWEREVDGATRIERAESDDGGLTFGTPLTVLDSAGGPDWLGGRVGSPAVLRRSDGSWSLAFVTGNREAIGLATSADGVTFDLPTGPALSAAASEDGGIGGPSLAEVDGALWLYFDVGLGDKDPTHIALAVSTDGSSYERRGVVLSPGVDCNEADGSRTRCWDADRVAQPEVRVARTASGRRVFRMWYAGAKRSKGDIGFAASVDGVVWSRFAFNPIVADPSRDEAEPTNVLLGSRYLLFFYDERSRKAHGIGLAVGAAGAPSEHF